MFPALSTSALLLPGGVGSRGKDVVEEEGDNEEVEWRLGVEW